MDVPEDHVEITHDGRRVGGRGGAYAAAVGQAWHKRRGRQPVSCLVATVSMLLETLC